MENTVEKLGEKIANLRNARGWSQETLAAESGVGRRTIQNIESGTTESPGIDSVIDLAQALGVSVAYLIDDKPTRGERVLVLQSKLLAMSEDDFETVEMTVNNLADIAREPSKSRISK